MGIAWRPLQKTVVRLGYGINYNLAQYSTMVQNFAFQPPFANAATNATTVASLVGAAPLTLTSGFPTVTQGTVSNNFAVNPNYGLGYVQIWNLDLQREVAGNVVLNIGYNGSKSTRLDTERALVVGDNQPFIYESSEGNSILHAASVRARRRMSKGLGIGAQYVFSKSIDDASSIGGGGVVVAQNPFDLRARIAGFPVSIKRISSPATGCTTFPLGKPSPCPERRHLPHPFQLAVERRLTMLLASISLQRAGSRLSIARGVSGSLRANLVPGQSSSVSQSEACGNGSTPPCFRGPWSNLTNPSNSPYGDATRNSIEGPGMVTMDMTINRTIPIKDTRSLDFASRPATSSIT